MVHCILFNSLVLQSGTLYSRLCRVEGREGGVKGKNVFFVNYNFSMKIIVKFRRGSVQ